MSSHHQSGKPLPDELIEKLISSRLVNAGLLNLRQLFFGIYDMTIHAGEEGVSTASRLSQLYEMLRSEITLLDQPPNLHPAATWGHLMGGYDVGYYGYMWSLVFAADIYASGFEGKGKKEVEDSGWLYRQKVLQPGGSKSGMDMLVDYLGRPPNSKAFLKMLGF